MYKKNDIIQFFKKAKITNIKRVCELICFSFQSSESVNFYLHISCFTRVFDSDKTLVICTQNLNDKSPNNKKRNFNWSDVGATVFDDAVNDYKEKLLSTFVSNISFDNDDIKIVFDNGMRMDVLTSVTKYNDLDYDENYRIFNDDENKEHYCCPPIKGKTE